MKRTLLILAAILAMLPAVAGAYSELHMQDNLHVRNEPDVLADTLTRIEGGGPVPLLLVLRHTNLYPTMLDGVNIEVDLGEGYDKLRENIDYGLKLKRPMWYDLRTIDLPEGYSGEIVINVEFNLRMKSGKLKVRNDNRRKSKREPLRVLVGAEPLPRFENWYYGDAHFHTLFSDNPAEFGAPVQFSARMAALFGLDWQVFTDHSFDLDDVEGDTNTNDPELARYGRYVDEITACAEEYPEVTFIVGEELSCGNAAGQNVHMLVFNLQQLYIGNGDGFEGENTPDHPCAEVTASLDPAEAAFAAHPITDINSVEMYVINRGMWSPEDMRIEGLNGLQAWNQSAAPIPGGIEEWVKVLLEGGNKYLLAGTDAHGCFNYKYSDWPSGMPFGNIRSAVYVQGELTVEKFIAALRSGRIVTTSGPLATVEIMNAAGDVAGVGGKIHGGAMMAIPRVRSTEEFGPVKEIRVILGDLVKGEEVALAKYSGDYADDPMDMDQTVQLPEQFTKGYVRVEAESEKDGFTYLAFTNPVWFER